MPLKNQGIINRKNGFFKPQIRRKYADLPFTLKNRVFTQTDYQILFVFVTFTAQTIML
jgi:hypothetical protein